MAEVKQVQCSFDPLAKKLDLLQDYVSARDESSSTLYKRFGVIPSNEGRKLSLKNGSYFYSEESVHMLLDGFQDACNDMCGMRYKSR